jgi:hypothetical protein
MKYLRIIALLALPSLSLMSCAHLPSGGYLDLKKVSMNEMNDPNLKLKKIGVANEKFCASDENFLKRVGVRR